MQGTVMSAKKKSQPYIPRAWKWTRVKRAGNKSLANMIDEEEEFILRMYIYTPQGTS